MKIYLCGSFDGPLTGQMQTLNGVYDSLKENFKISKINFPYKDFLFPFKWVLFAFNLVYILIFDKNKKVFYLLVHRTRISFWLRDFPVLAFSYITNSNLICHLVGSDIEIFFNKLNLVETFILRKLYSKVDHWVVLGPVMENQLKNLYQKLDINKSSPCFSQRILKATTVGGFFPIESDSFYDEKKIEKKINNFGQEIYIGYMSNLIEEKGIVEYIEAVISLKEKTNISFKAWIGGITLGNISPRLKNALVTANKKEYIEVCGLLKGDDKWNKLMNTNIFILPSYYKPEALPLSLVEAMRFGSLCISSDIGEIKNLLSNERGIILEEVKTENIINSIKKSSENIEISKNIMKRSNSFISDEFSFDSFKSKIENLVKNILVKG